MILIVDDDSRNIFALEATLKVSGFKIVTASNAVEGFMMLRNHPEINIVLLDMMMPEMDGYTAIPFFKEIRNVPIIAITAQAMDGDREKTLKAGADDYVSKPINVERLLQIIEYHKK